MHDDPDDPPRRRANKRRGHGTYANDRPPVAGVVGRESGQIRLRVLHNSTQAQLQPVVADATTPDATLYTDEWGGYNEVPDLGLKHLTCCHKPTKRVWARDHDGDGINEVHCNTMEGVWTGLRNYLRIFRGVRKDRLHLYIAIFEWSHNIKTATTEFLRTMLGVRSTNHAT